MALLWSRSCQQCQRSLLSGGRTVPLQGQQGSHIPASSRFATERACGGTELFQNHAYTSARQGKLHVLARALQLALAPD